MKLLEAHNKIKYAKTRIFSAAQNSLGKKSVGLVKNMQVSIFSTIKKVPSRERRQLQKLFWVKCNLHTS